MKIRNIAILVLAISGGVSLLAAPPVQRVVGLAPKADLLPKDEDLWRIVFYSKPIHRAPNTDIDFAIYGYNAKLLTKARVHINNLGLMSVYDYELEKKPGEIRIAVIGGEQTASSVVSKSWPDFLQDRLRAADPSRPYSVVNCGWPDAGPAHYIEYWQQECWRFKPDLVIVNFPEHDYYRTVKGVPLTIQGQPIESTVYAYSVAGFSVTINVAVPRGHRLVSPADPISVPSRPYGTFAPSEFFFNTQNVLALQKLIVADMVKGGLPRLYDPLPSAPADEDQLVAYAVEKFGWIVRNIPNVVLVHNFNASELTATWHLTRRMEEADQQIKVVDARKLIAPGTTQEEINSWSMVGVMGEKFSETGMQAYAGLIEKVVWQNLKLGGASQAP